MKNTMKSSRAQAVFSLPGLVVGSEGSQRVGQDLAQSVVGVEALGFIPRNALHTLSMLSAVSDGGFSSSGSIEISQESLKEVLVAAAQDELRVEIQGRADDRNAFELKFRAKASRDRPIGG